jgi:hypothetical protein
MNNTTLGRQLNDIFETLYHLFNYTIVTPKYLSYLHIQKAIGDFMSTVETESQLDMSQEKREGLGELYFESGNNGVNVIYYPFDSNSYNICPFKMNDLFYTWNKALECIIDNCDDINNVNKAKILQQKILNLLV